MDKKELEILVRKVVMELVGGGDADKRTAASGVLSVRLPNIRPEKFDTGKEGDKVLLKDVLTLDESPRLGCGVMEMEETAFDWTLRYDEVDYVIEGTLEILTGGEKVTAEAGSVIYIPANSSITFSVPKFARFLYVTYPANWASAG